MKALLIGDVHLADRPPRSCTPKYTPNLFEMLHEAFEIARSADVDFIGFAGDIFHHKRPSKTSHKLVADFAALLKTVDVPVVAAIGNHDLFHDSHEFFSDQPLNVLLQAGLLQPEFFKVYLWHWNIDFEPPDNTELVIAHQGIGHPTNPLIWDEVQADDVAERFDGAVFFGHTHDDLDVFVAGSALFCNNGALCRGTLSDTDLNRDIYVTIYESGLFSKVRLESALKVEELYDEELLAQKWSKEQPQIDLDEWFVRLRDAGPQAKSPPIDRAIAKINVAPVSAAVKERSIGLLRDG